MTCILTLDGCCFKNGAFPRGTCPFLMRPHGRINDPEHPRKSVVLRAGPVWSYQLSYPASTFQVSRPPTEGRLDESFIISLSRADVSEQNVL